MAASSPPPYARPFHTIHTPRLLIRSSIVSDALAVNIIRTEELNSPFGGIVEPALTLAVQRERIASAAITTAEGENAWMVVIIKDPQPGDQSIEGLRVEEGVLIGNTGFNSFPLKPTLVDSSKEAIVADTGALIDYRFARKGYAIETMSAVIEYAFADLGCGMISLDTNFDNQPFRNLMRTMGIGEGSTRGEGKEQEVLYLFDKEMWESAKKQMKSNGKWYL